MDDMVRYTFIIIMDSVSQTTHAGLSKQQQGRKAASFCKNRTTVKLKTKCTLEMPYKALSKYFLFLKLLNKNSEGSNIGQITI